MSAVHPEPGLRVGDRYVLTERIAGGGMGEVWRALDDVLGREVAVKLLRREYVDDDAFLTRFRAEARHAASLSHPGIASVYDYGEVDGVAYLVMELVDGEPLSARLARDGALPAALAVPMLQQAAAALQAAHDAGLVHRDVKPANLLLTGDDQVKITDFGIARAGDQAPITRTGEVMGTAQYLSPEQALGRGATPASDVYALGVVAYEALSGRRPFDADSMVATAMAQVNDPPPPLPAEVPASVAAVVLQALAKDPADRPASAADLGAAFGAALTAAPSRGAGPFAPAADPTQAMAATEAMLLADAPAAVGPLGVPTPTAALPAVAGASGSHLTGTTLPPRPRESRARRRRTALLAVLAVLVVVALVALALNQLGGGGAGTAGAGPTTSNRSTGASPSSTTSSTSRTTSDSPPPSQTSQASTPSTITLDPAAYVGRRVQDVRKELAQLGLEVRSERVPSDQKKDVVLSLSPTDGLTEGDTVTVQVSDGKGADTGSDTPPPSPSTPSSGSSSSSSSSGVGNGSSTPTPTDAGTGAAAAQPTSVRGGTTMISTKGTT